MPKTARSKNIPDEVPASSPDAPLLTNQGPYTEAIAKRAYEMFLERGGAHGNDTDDWLQAELEFRQRIGEVLTDPQ